jgi:hypothetical protein
VFNGAHVDASQIETFSALFSPAAFSEVFTSRFARARSKGIDRLSGFQFAQRSVVALTVASDKCVNGSFRFSPYLETLKLKGRGKAPRVVGIPTVRDRVVLHQLNAFLKAVFPECIPANIANGYLRTLAAGRRGPVLLECGLGSSASDAVRRELRYGTHFARHGLPRKTCLDAWAGAFVLSLAGANAAPKQHL